MEGSLSVWMVVISMVGIDVVTRVFVEAIREGRKLGFEKLRGKFKCLQGECRSKSLKI